MLHVLALFATAHGSAAAATTFWQITDAHLNMQYPSGCGSCNNDAAGCHKFADFFCGSSPALYTSAARFMASGDVPAFVAHTGDVPDVWNAQNDDNITALHLTSNFSASTLYAALPASVPVFFAFGNHDFPMPSTKGGSLDCPFLPGCAPHYKAMCAGWARDLGAAGLSSCEATGYYFVDGKVPGVRIVVINTQFFNWEMGIDLANATQSGAANAQLAWLAETVSSAPEKVIILGHIPPLASYGFYEENFSAGKYPGNVAPGVQMWWQSHIEQFNAIVGRAGKKVTAQLFGHIHVDTFYISRFSSKPGNYWHPPGSGRPPSAVQWVGLSLVASYPPKNGGVNKFTMDDESKELVDVERFFYSVRESNATGKIEWKSSWKASDDGTTTRSRGGTYSLFVAHNLCMDKDMIGAGGSAKDLGACKAACTAEPTCRFFGFEAKPEWCILYSNCTARSPPGAGGAKTYTVYKRQGASFVTAAKITAADLANISSGWKQNASSHLEYQSRAYGRADQGSGSTPVKVFGDCTGNDKSVDGARCRLQDACSASSTASSEYALCLLNRGCVDSDGMRRESKCVPLKTEDHAAWPAEARDWSVPVKPNAAHGLTPPMGWSTWYAFGGNLSEAKVLQVGDLMVSSGLLAAGYEYLNLDDAWLAPMRDRFGKMQADFGRFPSGMKSLAQKLNAKGLRLGLYGDPGIRTCMGYPGQFEHEYTDAQTLADWNVEFWKYDQCWHKIPLIDILAREAYSQGLPSTATLSNGDALGMNVRGMSAVGQDANFAGDRITEFTSSARDFVGPQINMSGLPASWVHAETWNGAAGEGGIPGTQIQYYEAYRLFGEALAATGHNITYSICPFIAGCDKSIWSYYKDVAHTSMNQCPEHDATDSWTSFMWHVDDSLRNGVGAASQPGYFNDLDFLQIGFKALSDQGAGHPLMSDDQYRSEFSIFCLLAAPLIMSNDITKMTKADLATLTNKEMIAIDQDALGISGTVVFNSSDGCNLLNTSCTQDSTIPNPNMFIVYARPLFDGSVAIGLMNRAPSTAPYSPFVAHSLCMDKDMIGAGGSAKDLGACKAACTAEPTCRFFGFEAKPEWCILYSNCTARSPPGAGGAKTYTVYKREGSSVKRNHTISLDLSAISVPASAKVNVRDVWAQQDLGVVISGKVEAEVCSLCTVVLRLSLVGGAKIPFKPWPQV